MLRPLGVAFIVSLLASTIVALTLTPVLCSLMLGNERENGKLSREPRLAKVLGKAYSRSLSWIMGHSRGMLAGTALLFVGSLIVYFTLGSGFLPDSTRVRSLSM